MKQKSKSRTWLANLLSQKSATQDRKKQQGDTIAGQVEGSENVVIGKNVIQIGSIKIPRSIAVLLAVVSGLVAIAATFLVYQSLPDTVMPPGPFNIGVAELIAYDINENRIRPDEAYKLSMSIASYLKGQEEMLVDPWLKRGIEVWGPDQLARRQPNQSVEEYSKKINADVLVYGTLYEKESGRWELKPEFYLDDEVVRQAEELRGEHALGTSINYSDNLVHIDEVNETLEIRIKALVQIVMSLSNIVLGNEDNYRKAVNIMEEAIQDPEWGAAGDNTGQEVLYLFLGNAYMSIATQGTEEERIALSIQSRDAFLTAIALNNNYARAYNGLGFSLFQSTVGTSEQCLPETSDAISQKFKTALELPDHAKPESGNVDYRATWGLARVAFSKVTMCGDMTAVAEAKKYYKVVIKEFVQITEIFDDLTDMAISAYTELGIIAFLQSLNIIPLDTVDSAHEDMISESIENFEQAFKLSFQSNTVESETYTNRMFPFYLQSLCLNNQAELLHQEANEFYQSPDALDEIQNIIDSEQWKECKNGF